MWSKGRPYGGGRKSGCGGWMLGRWSVCVFGGGAREFGCLGGLVIGRTYPTNPTSGICWWCWLAVFLRREWLFLLFVVGCAVLVVAVASFVCCRWWLLQCCWLWWPSSAVVEALASFVVGCGCLLVGRDGPYLLVVGGGCLVVMKVFFVACRPQRKIVS